MKGNNYLLIIWLQCYCCFHGYDIIAGGSVAIIEPSVTSACPLATNLACASVRPPVSSLYYAD